MGTPILTKRDIEMGALRPSEEAFNNSYSQAYAGEIKKQHDKAAADAKIAELVKGRQLDEESRKKHIGEVIPRLKELNEQFPGMSFSMDETGNVTQHPIDTMDKQLKREMLRSSMQDREDRQKALEADRAQKYYSAQGGKDFAQKNMILERAKALYEKGDPESLRMAELELAQGVAKNALTMPEYNALTAAHSMGNKMQATTKGLSSVASNVLPSAIGDPIAHWLSQKADKMQTMTPDEIADKKAAIEQIYGENRAASDRIANEMRARAPQLMPRTYRSNPKDVDTVLGTLGARIPQQLPGATQSQAPSAQPQQQEAPTTKQVGGKTYIRVNGGWQEQ